MATNYKYQLAWLIDDNYIDNAINSQIVKSAGFAQEVSCFEQAEKALNSLKVCIAEQLPYPDVIFLDLRMPEIDGYAFLTEIQKIPNLDLEKLKIYILTSSLDPTDQKKIADIQLTQYFINKPLTEHTLLKL